jgi:hypothetical protein
VDLPLARRGSGHLHFRLPWNQDLMLVQMASSAAFVIKNPGKANDSQAVSLAGFESSLRAYEKLVATDPKARSKQMDEMLAKGTDGSLAAFMTEKIKKECK